MRLALAIVAMVLTVLTLVFWGGADTPELLGPGEGTSVGSGGNAAPSAAEVGRTVEVYDGIRVPGNAVVVDLSGRGLRDSLKAEVGQLTDLRELNLSGNRFTGLPAEVGRLADLQLLNLSDNPLTGLPLELGQLQNLEVLDLRGTDYSMVDLAAIAEMLPETTTIIVDDPEE